LQFHQHPSLERIPLITYTQNKPNMKAVIVRAQQGDMTTPVKADIVDQEIP
jgi:hypothetical protein